MPTLPARALLLGLAEVIMPVVRLPRRRRRRRARDGKVGPDRTPLHGALYNARDGRNPRLPYEFVTRLVDGRPWLDFILVCESGRYQRALDNVPGWSVAAADRRSGSCLLVRDGVATHAEGRYRLGFSPWPYNGKMKPRRAMAHGVLGGWLRAGAIHLPPGVNWEHGRMGYRWHGRQRAYAACARRLVRFANRHPGRPLLFGGDWNEPASTWGQFTPRWVCNRIGGEMAGGHHLDHLVTRDCRTDHVRHIASDSDHPVVLFTVRKD